MRILYMEVKIRVLSGIGSDSLTGGQQGGIQASGVTCDISDEVHSSKVLSPPIYSSSLSLRNFNMPNISSDPVISSDIVQVLTQALKTSQARIQTLEETLSQRVSNSSRTSSRK